MNISWYGERCVRIETKDGSVLLDPFDPREVGLRGPTIKDDIVLFSSYIPAKEALDRVNDDALIIRGPGEYEKKSIGVKGIQAYQDTQEGAELGLATIYLLMAEEMTVCYLGSVGQSKLTDIQLEAIGDPDILIIPAGGSGGLDAKAAAALATHIEPKIIIPIHYALPNASYEAEKLDKFVKEIGLPAQNMETFRMQKKQLPTDQTLLVVLSA